MNPHSSFNVIYIGGPTAILEIGGLRIMTDPSLDPAGSVYHSGSLVHEKTMGPANVNIGQIDVVLLSHDQHYDNLDYAGRALVEKVGITFSTRAAAARLNGRVIGLRPWESHSIETPDGTEIMITATPARHGPAGTEELQGEVVGFVIMVQGEQTFEVYITGDTTFYEGVAEVAKRFRPSYVFIFAGAAQVRGPFNVTMGTNDAMDTAVAFPMATIIPLHYEGWKHYTQNEMDLKASFEVVGFDKRLMVLELGKVTSLPIRAAVKDMSPTAAEKEKPVEGKIDDVVIDGECGDTLWDKVMAQKGELTTGLDSSTDQVRNGVASKEDGASSSK